MGRAGSQDGGAARNRDRDVETAPVGTIDRRTGAPIGPAQHRLLAVILPGFSSFGTWEKSPASRRKIYSSPASCARCFLPHMRSFELPALRRWRHFIFCGLMLGPAALPAFPPAPFHTLYGMVRDEHGNSLQVEGAEVVLYRGATEVLRQTIGTGRLLDQNYQIRLRMDMFRPGTQTYTGLATNAGEPFSLAIILNNIVYHPIEMSTPRAVGRPGQRIRLELTLGVDSVGDGIPDAWKQSQLSAAGILPDENGWNLGLITRDGDFDGDGVSNWNEYLAGTYAVDPDDLLELQVIEKVDGYAHLRFFGLYGKTYSLESSPDLITWTATVIHLPEPDQTDRGDLPDPLIPQDAVSAKDTSFIDLYAPTAPMGRTFYRLKVR